MNVLVVGYDIWAKRILEVLSQTDATYTLLTTDDGLSPHHPTVSVDTIEEAAFQEAGIGDMDAVLVATLDDQHNVLAVLTAADLATDATIVTFVNERTDAPKLRRAGADTVVIIGQVIAELLVETALSDADPETIIDSIFETDRAIETANEAELASTNELTNSPP